MDDFGQQLINDGSITTTIIGTEGAEIEGATGRINGKNVTNGFQLYNGDTFNTLINIIIPQEGPYSGQRGSFKTIFAVSQYNGIS